MKIFRTVYGPPSNRYLASLVYKRQGTVQQKQGVAVSVTAVKLHPIKNNIIQPALDMSRERQTIMAEKILQVMMAGGVEL